MTTIMMTTMAMVMAPPTAAARTTVTTMMTRGEGRGRLLAGFLGEPKPLVGALRLDAQGDAVPP